MKVLINSRQDDGWGDVISTIFQATGFINHLIDNFPNMEVMYFINDNHNLGQLQHILNFEYFESITNRFGILSDENKIQHLGGYTIFEGIRYERAYSVCNYSGLNTNVPGKFDIFVLDENKEEFMSLNLPFENFNWHCLDNRAKYYPVINPKIIEKAEEFVKNNFEEDFESIRWRWSWDDRECNIENQEKKFKEYIKYLESKVDLRKYYFFSSNSRRLKDIVNSSKIKVKFYWSLDDHSVDNTPVGPLLFDKDISESIITVTEIMILTYCKKIYYSYCNLPCSLFNWVAINSKKIPMETVHVHIRDNESIINSEYFN
jgi:hypothetical protein